VHGRRNVFTALILRRIFHLVSTPAIAQFHSKTLRRPLDDIRCSLLPRLTCTRPSPRFKRTQSVISRSTNERRNTPDCTREREREREIYSLIRRPLISSSMRVRESALSRRLTTLLDYGLRKLIKIIGKSSLAIFNTVANGISQRYGGRYQQTSFLYCSFP